MQEIILTIGEWTNKQLADFFGIKEATFRSKRIQKLKALQDYAEFEVLRGKVNITKVKEAVPYCPKRQMFYKTIGELVDKTWSSNGFDTVVNVADKIKDDPRLAGLSFSTVQYYVRKYHTENFGSPKRKDGGKKGFCKFKWGKRDINRFKQPQYFTEEEEKYYNALIEKAYGVDPEYEAEKEAILQSYKETDAEYIEFQKEDKERHNELWKNIVEQGMYDKYSILLIKGTQDEWLAWMQQNKGE